MTGHNVKASFQTIHTFTAKSESKWQSFWYQTEVVAFFLCHPYGCPTTRKASFQTKQPHFPFSPNNKVGPGNQTETLFHFLCHANDDSSQSLSHTPNASCRASSYFPQIKNMNKYQQHVVQYTGSLKWCRELKPSKQKKIQMTHRVWSNTQCGPLQILLLFYCHIIFYFIALEMS